MFWLCADVTVKIFTLSEDQLQEEGREGVSESTTFENSDGDLTNSMSRLLDSLLVSSACNMHCGVRLWYLEMYMYTNSIL